MGRLDIVIPDELETQLRIEVIKRFGGRKGDLSKAMIEAVDLWVNQNTVERLKKVAIGGIGDARTEAVESLSEMGLSAINALITVGNEGAGDDRELAMTKVKEILKKSKR